MDLKRVGGVMGKKKDETKKPTTKKLSRRDIEELMGTHRDTYKRHNGAIRRK